MKTKQHSIHEARAAKKVATELLSPLATVVGVSITRVGVGYGLKVNLERSPGKPLPKHVGGVPIRVEVVGPISKR